MGSTEARLKECVKALLDDAVAEEVFPGASACIAFRESGEWSYVRVAAGHLAPGRRKVVSGTVYDLASITKPFVAMTALALEGQNGWSVDAPVSAHVPEAKGEVLGERTWADVSSHRAGLRAWVALYELGDAGETVDERKAAAVRFVASAAAMSQTEGSLYSDLGYILAGVTLERVMGASLDRLVREGVVSRLGVEGEVVDYAPMLEADDALWRSRCAPTGASHFRPGVELRGEVHDDNSAFLGGVTGHAGMFGTAGGVARFGAEMIDAWHGRSQVLSAQALRPRLAPQPGGSHRFGWDGYEIGGSAGSQMSESAFGHLGFTGTSLWCDPERELAVVLLSNRVYKSIDHIDIRAFRPRFHDAVVAAFDGDTTD